MLNLKHITFNLRFSGLKGKCFKLRNDFLPQNGSTNFMKTTILHITILFISTLTFGQTQILKNYDFNEGGYYILGTYSESDRNGLRDSIGEFYTNDTSFLNQIKADWVFSIPGKKYACGYHYDISICKYGLILESFSINLNCDEIVTDKGYFYFHSDKLRKYYGRFKKPYRKRNDFDNIEKARAYRDSILNDNNLIMTPSPNWTTYEGTFQFEYECKEGSKDCNFENTKRTLGQITKIIKEKYPNENFEIYEMGGSLMTITVEVKCNRTLSDKFDLFIRDSESYFGKFKPYRLDLTTYWKR